MRQTLVALLMLLTLAGLTFALVSHEVKDPQLNEISGIAASRINKDIYYVHNDSGGKNEVYALDKKGKLVAILILTGVKNRDWEDIAIGPGPGTGIPYIYVGEIGDNNGKHRNLCLYLFKEPVLSAKTVKRNKNIKITEIDSLGFIFADGPKDCETLMIDPANGDVWLVSKREAKVGVYQIPAPLRTDTLNVAKRVLTLNFPLAVSGDISPQRNYILIKTYGNVYGWQLKPNQSIAEALSSPPVTLPYEVEPQGEAICFSASGKSYFTISEKTKDNPLFLNSYKLSFVR